MDSLTLAALEKDVRRLRRIASEWAGQLHDLVEDRLPAAFQEIPGIAQSTYDACQAWAEAEARLTAARTESPL
ncbi:CCE_0567 family metalloprotein [Niveibacterium sp.]|uniref:CCE_0567 family metalloprotein n=1 Tax=Niveibacterium sp. TaxID=2017444 RepID=UPI0035B1C770